MRRHCNNVRGHVTNKLPLLQAPYTPDLEPRRLLQGCRSLQHIMAGRSALLSSSFSCNCTGQPSSSNSQHLTGPVQQQQQQQGTPH